MRQIGSLCILLGLGSMVLHFLDREFTLLSWIDTWGSGAAWGIRAGLVVAGVLLVKAGKNKKPAATTN